MILICVQDNESLQFISGMKLKGDELWIASNRIQNIFGNNTDTGFRYRIVLIKSIRHLLETAGRKCLQSDIIHSWANAN